VELWNVLLLKLHGFVEKYQGEVHVLGM